MDKWNYQYYQGCKVLLRKYWLSLSIEIPSVSSQCLKIGEGPGMSAGCQLMWCQQMSGLGWALSVLWTGSCGHLCSVELQPGTLDPLLSAEPFPLARVVSIPLPSCPLTLHKRPLIVRSKVYEMFPMIQQIGLTFVCTTYPGSYFLG
jgi:hypothetical protein